MRFIFLLVFMFVGGVAAASEYPESSFDRARAYLDCFEKTVTDLKNSETEDFYKKVLEIRNGYDPHRKKTLSDKIKLWIEFYCLIELSPEEVNKHSDIWWWHSKAGYYDYFVKMEWEIYSEANKIIDDKHFSDTEWWDLKAKEFDDFKKYLSSQKEKEREIRQKAIGALLFPH